MVKGEGLGLLGYGGVSPADEGTLAFLREEVLSFKQKKLLSLYEEVKRLLCESGVTVRGGNLPKKVGEIAVQICKQGVGLGDLEEEAWDLRDKEGDLAGCWKDLCVAIKDSRDRCNLLVDPEEVVEGIWEKWARAGIIICI